MAEFENRKEDMCKQIDVFTHDMTRLRRLNSSWDAGLTITTIVLTLMITILSSLNQINEEDKIVGTSILGAVIVAIQAIGNAFPVKQKAGSYRLLQTQANNLLVDVEYVENPEELKNISSQFRQLRMEAAKVETE